MGSDETREDKQQLPQVRELRLSTALVVNCPLMVLQGFFWSGLECIIKQQLCKL
jgi:hypothetical protein